MTKQTEVLLRPTKGATLARSRAVGWLDKADALGNDATALAQLTESRKAYNAQAESYALEAVRHVAGGIVGTVFSALAGAVLGILEGAGTAIAATVCNRPFIAAPTLLVFLLSLVAQTYAMGAMPLSWALIGQLLTRALWCALLTALAAAVIVGIVNAQRNDQGDSND